MLALPVSFRSAEQVGLAVAEADRPQWGMESCKALFLPEDLYRWPSLNDYLRQEDRKGNNNV